ncbi:urokinase plasminogen activator surface receptor-like [Puntigrus tetrazona]|uniref:urokinase plasminogen activator surface receptor-like n=1 Tax=Puntigrus tetrazona TaxID=1606681 RepID=UPI001C8AD0A9|nr:urokinase plasminogen activator surface receptor-like [Puntigrus tetrazona]
MDLQISGFLLFVLFTAGHSFSCYNCDTMTGSCVNQTVQNCTSPSPKCGSITSVSETGSVKVDMKLKQCVGDCVNGSMNVGILRTSSVCCDTDLCNFHDSPDPNSLPPNGKKCYYCDLESCSNTLSCTGIEDHCYTGSGFIDGRYMILKGCLSKSLCDSPELVKDGETTCCSEDLCNGV